MYVPILQALAVTQPLLRILAEPVYVAIAALAPLSIPVVAQPCAAVQVLPVLEPEVSAQVAAFQPTAAIPPAPAVVHEYAATAASLLAAAVRPVATLAALPAHSAVAASVAVDHHAVVAASAVAEAAHVAVAVAALAPDN